MGNSPSTMSTYEPGSPKTPGTIVRAKKGAGPLRQEVRDRMEALKLRDDDVTSTDRDVGVAMNGLDQSLKELENRIKREFSQMKQKLEDTMNGRSRELIGAAKLHFEKLLEVMKKQRELLGEEGTRVSACIDAALEALGLDDAWFIQAYPDITLDPGSNTVGHAREVLQGGNGSLSLVFDENMVSRVLLPSVKGHGTLNSSLHD